VESPSLTGRIMYRLAHRFFYQWPELKRYFPKAECGGPLL
jgi:UDP-N-acetylglucosamine:LPS N-acetylglucosamine transferase